MLLEDDLKFAVHQLSSGCWRTHMFLRVNLTLSKDERGSK